VSGRLELLRRRRRGLSAHGDEPAKATVTVSLRAEVSDLTDRTECAASGVESRCTTDGAHRLGLGAGLSGSPMARMPGLGGGVKSAGGGAFRAVIRRPDYPRFGYGMRTCGPGGPKASEPLWLA
jgi:hypothetical protein